MALLLEGNLARLPSLNSDEVSYSILCETSSELSEWTLMQCKGRVTRFKMWYQYAEWPFSEIPVSGRKMTLYYPKPRFEIEALFNDVISADECKIKYC